MPKTKPPNQQPPILSQQIDTLEQAIIDWYLYPDSRPDTYTDVYQMFTRLESLIAQHALACYLGGEG